MNTPSPLIPQGSLLKRASGKSNIRIAFFTIAAIHLVFIGGLLMQGCKRDTTPPGIDNEPEPPPQAMSFPPLNPEVPLAPPTDFPEPPPTNGSFAQPRPTVPEPVITQTPLAPEPPSAPGGSEYIVARGDSFWTIAQKHGVTVKAIEEANPGVDSTRLQIGQALYIPAPAYRSAPAVTTNGAAPAGSGGTITYTIQPGDSLTKIARDHGTTISRLKELNNMRTDRILVGQTLKVPAPNGARSTATDGI